MLSKFNGMMMVLSDTSNVFDEATKPVIQLLNSAINPILGVVVAIGAIYCILLGAKLAKAEEPQDREKAKSALKNAIIGFLLIFVLLVALKVAFPILSNWYSTYGSTSTK